MAVRIRSTWRFTALLRPPLISFPPDIYWPNFEYWVQRYRDRDNPLFVPEVKLDTAPFNAYYAYGEACAFGFSAFDVDSLPDVESEAGNSRNPLAQSYSVLQQLEDILPETQREGRTRGLVLHAGSLRPTQTASLGGYLLTATLARSWPTRALLQDDGAMILLETSPDEFLIGGTSLSISVSVDVDVREGIGGVKLYTVPSR